MTNSTLKMGRSEWALLVLLACLWGCSFLFMKIAVQTLPVFTVVFGRIGIAALLLIVIVYVRGLALPATWQQWQRFIWLGLLRAALPISLFVWAQTQLDSNVTGILNATSPLFTVIVAHFLTADEKLTRNKLIGIGLAMIGVVFLIGPSAIQGLRNNVIAQLAVLCATCSYGFAAVYGRSLRDVPVLVSTAGFLTGAALLIAPLALIIDKPWLLQPSHASLWAVLAIAVFSTACAFIVWLTLILRAGASNTSQVTFLIPIVAMLLGVIVLGEQLQWNSLIGLAFILLGLGVTQGRFQFAK